MGGEKGQEEGKRASTREIGGPECKQHSAFGIIRFTDAKKKEAKRCQNRREIAPLLVLNVFTAPGHATGI